MMRWGKKKPVSSSSSGLSRSHPVSWFSRLSGSSDLKPAKEKKQDEKASQNMSTKSSLSSTKSRNDIHQSSKRFQRASVEKVNTATRSADMESNEKFEEIMSSVRKKVRDFQRETRGFLEVEAMDRDKGTVIMTPRIQVNRDKQRCERRDQRLLEKKAKEIRTRRRGQGEKTSEKDRHRQLQYRGYCDSWSYRSKTGSSVAKAQGNKTKGSEAEGRPTEEISVPKTGAKQIRNKRKQQG